MENIIDKLKPDKESMYQESIKTVYYDLIRHITYYV